MATGRASELPRSQVHTQRRVRIASEGMEETKKELSLGKGDARAQKLLLRVSDCKTRGGI